MPFSALYPSSHSRAASPAYPPPVCSSAFSSFNCDCSLSSSTGTQIPFSALYPSSHSRAVSPAYPPPVCSSGFSSLSRDCSFNSSARTQIPFSSTNPSSHSTITRSEPSSAAYASIIGGSVTNCNDSRSTTPLKSASYWITTSRTIPTLIVTRLVTTAAVRRNADSTSISAASSMVYPASINIVRISCAICSTSWRICSKLSRRQKPS
mmetsp:Transcript_71560/g.113907  ORF Transcript_71560/g.113907 Transcript_71560/m.113907 type:complete len:208 (-) Transcript_71560:72-695(-)